MKPTDQTSDKPEGTARAPLSVMNAIAAIVDFYWNDEFQHYASMSKEERKGKRHIFQEFNVVRRWLSRGNAAFYKNRKH
ncbi:MAG: hypothetical protein SGI77_10345 [Pirellulaceae bacterium]|nr:hypothetical protein [Pirellulaceae bacterium]